MNDIDRPCQCGADDSRLRQVWLRKASGKDLHRPVREQLVGYDRERDTVVCQFRDRLAREPKGLLDVVLGFTVLGVHVRFGTHLNSTGEAPAASVHLGRRPLSRRSVWRGRCESHKNDDSISAWI